MTESTVETPAEDATAGPQEGTEAAEVKTFDAEYVDRLRKEAAKYRTEAKANAEAAKRLAEIEEAQKTESQRQAERLAAAEKAAADAEARVMRRELALEHRLSADDAALLDTVTDENGLRALAARLAVQSTPQGNSAPLEGEPPKKPVNDPGIDFVDRLVGRAL